MTIIKNLALAFLLLAQLAAGNDKFPDRTSLAGELPFLTSSSLLGATGGEIHGARASRWWTWTSDRSGWVEIELNSESPHSIVVYQGPDLIRLRTLASSSNQPAGNAVKLPFLAEEGQSYEIAILGTPAARPAPLSFHLSEIDHPSPNDDFENRINLGEALEVTLQVSNYGATAEPGEPNHKNRRPQASTWWTINPSESRNYQIGLPHPEVRAYRPRLVIYEGEQLATLREVAEIRTTLVFSRPDQLQEFQAEAGKSYHLAIDNPGYFNSENGKLELRIIGIPTQASAPSPNDLFQNATDLGSVREAEIQATFANASREFGEYIRPLSDRGVFWHLFNTSWWKWQCPESGTYGLLPIEPWSSGGQLQVFQENADGELSLTTFGEDSAVSFTAQEGDTFHFMIGSLTQGAVGQQTYQFRKINPSLNRSRETAASIGMIDDFSVTGENLTANGARLAWEWQPQTSGFYHLTMSGTIVPWRISVFQISEDGELIGISYNNQTDFFSIEGGKRYLLSIDPQRRRLVTFEGVRIPGATNGLFENATDLGAAEFVRSEATSLGAGLEEGEPPTTRDHSLWWKWQVPRTANWGFATTDLQSGIELFQGSNLQNLTLVSSLSYSNSIRSLQQGETYYLRMISYNQTPNILSIFPSFPTLNNLRSEAIDLGDDLIAEGRSSFLQATAENDEPGEQNLWWTWTAPQTGLYQITAPGDIQVAFFRGNPADPFQDLTQVKYSRRIYNWIHDVFEAQAGESYLIATFSETVGPAEIHLKISPIAPPAGDLFETPISLGNDEVVRFVGEGTRATFSSSDPEIDRSALASIWLTWTAPRSGPYRIDGRSLLGTREDDRIGVFTGDDPNSLSTLGLVAEEDIDFPGINFEAIEGTEYKIAFWAGGDFETYEIRIAPISSYTEWADNWQEGLSEAAREMRSEEDFLPNSIPQNDGLTNFTKYVFGLNPTLHRDHDHQARNLPSLTSTDQFLELNYRLGNRAASARTVPIRHLGEWSRDGTTWETVEPEALGLARFRVRIPIDGGGKFLRVRAFEE